MTKRLNPESITPRRGFRLGILLIALAPILISVLSPITLAAAGFARQSLLAVFRIIKPNKASGQSGPAWLEQAAIRAMFRKHNDYLAEFAQWRGLFARRAKELATLVKTFPGGEDLSDEELRRIIVQAHADLSGRHAAEIFQPWTNCWAGLWSNGAPQYHVWDSTRFVDGQWMK